MVHVTLLLALLPLSAADGVADEQKKLDGHWQATKATLAGKELPEPAVKAIKLEMKGGKYTVGNDRGTVRVDPDKKPREMDIKGVEGPNKGKTFLCIYVLEDDKLIICYDLSGKGRPKKFESKPNSSLFLVEYERVKEVIP